MIDVNIVAVLAATIVTMAVATVWYAPSVFGNRWMRLVGLSMERVEADKANLWKRFAAGFVAQFLTLYVLSHFLVIADAYETTSGVGAAFWIAVLVIAFSANATIWEMKKVSYFLINTGYSALALIGGGAIIFYWPW